MIVIAIIGILAAIAVPQYAQYTRRAAFSEVKLAATPIKTAVDLCVQRNGSAGATGAGVVGCFEVKASGANNQITAEMLERAEAAAGVTDVQLGGAADAITVTVIPAAENGIVAADTYILTGTGAAGGSISNWTESGQEKKRIVASHSSN